MVNRITPTAIRKTGVYGQQSSGEPGSIFASRDSCCPGDCNCSFNYGCKCDHDCTCPDSSLVDGEKIDLILPAARIASLVGRAATELHKLQGATTTGWTRGDSETPDAMPISDEELYHFGDVAPTEDTLVGDTPLNDRIYKDERPFDENRSMFVDIDDEDDLIEYLDSVGMSIEQFKETSDYKENVDKHEWLRDL